MRIKVKKAIASMILTVSLAISPLATLSGTAIYYSYKAYTKEVFVSETGEPDSWQPADIDQILKDAYLTAYDTPQAQPVNNTGVYTALQACAAAVNAYSSYVTNIMTEEDQQFIKDAMEIKDLVLSVTSDILDSTHENIKNCNTNLSSSYEYIQNRTNTYVQHFYDAYNSPAATSGSSGSTLVGYIIDAFTPSGSASSAESAAKQNYATEKTKNERALLIDITKTEMNKYKDALSNIYANLKYIYEVVMKIYNFFENNSYRVDIELNSQTDERINNLKNFFLSMYDVEEEFNFLNHELDTSSQLRITGNVFLTLCEYGSDDNKILGLFDLLNTELPIWKENFQSDALAYVDFLLSLGNAWDQVKLACAKAKEALDRGFGQEAKLKTICMAYRVAETMWLWRGSDANCKYCEEKADFFQKMIDDFYG